MAQLSGQVGLAAEGMRYLLQAPFALVVLAVSVLGLCRRSRNQSFAWLVLLVLCAIATSLIPPSRLNGYLATGYVAMGGLALAAGLGTGNRSAGVFAVGGGIALGLTAGLQTAMAAEAIGTLATALLLCTVTLLAIHSLSRAASEQVIGLAQRIAGAWMAAVGLLMFALEAGNART